MDYSQDSYLLLFINIQSNRIGKYGELCNIKEISWEIYGGLFPPPGFDQKPLFQLHSRDSYSYLGSSFSPIILRKLVKDLQRPRIVVMGLRPWLDIHGLFLSCNYDLELQKELLNLLPIIPCYSLQETYTRKMHLSHFPSLPLMYTNIVGSFHEPFPDSRSLVSSQMIKFTRDMYIHGYSCSLFDHPTSIQRNHDLYKPVHGCKCFYCRPLLHTGNVNYCF